ncbi:Sec-independent protein translocase protein TatB [Paraburkholderia sp. BR14374]|uniref:Sec-independent protein translocase protein TatB n=1 Tax=Paraburkholderia sp. BR14374 TaxID=3237007 RepID=UPI0034CF33AF
MSAADAAIDLQRRFVARRFTILESSSMLDVDFSKLLLIAAVAVVVLGPERLPLAARALAVLIGRSRRYLDDLRSQVTEDLELGQLRAMKSQIESGVQEFAALADRGGSLTRNAVTLLDADTSETPMAAPPEHDQAVRPARLSRRATESWRANAPTTGAGDGHPPRRSRRHIGAAQPRPLRHAAARRRNRILMGIAR